ncbi:MAG: hypothetical protein AB7O86_05775 [Porticoccaceae bacterium]
MIVNGEIVITVDNADRIDQMLRAVANSLSPSGLGRFLDKRVDPFLSERAADRFASEGDDASGKWAQLLEATGYIRLAKGFGRYHPINVRTGDLRNFVVGTHTTSAVAGGASMVKPAVGGSGEMQKKLRAAQRGGVGPKGRPFPARPVVVLNSTDRLEIESLLKFWVESAASRAQSRGAVVL